MIYKDYLSLIGNTPVIKYNDFYLKLESFNPGLSIKDRPALRIIEKMMEKGLLKENDTIVEATSGNMGISLSMIGRHKKLNVIIVMPEGVSKERIEIIKSYGAEVVLSQREEKMIGATKIAKEIARKEKGVFINQFENCDNYLAHVTTALEIYNDFEKLDYVVISVGSGGTITGISKVLKELYKDIKIIAIESKEAKFLKGELCNNNMIPGLGSDFVPKILNMDEVDDIIDISSLDAISKTKKLLNEGYSFGISSSAVILACEKIKKDNPGKIILGICPDSSDKYRSILND